MIRRFTLVIALLSACGTGDSFPDDPSDHEPGLPDLVIGAACASSLDCMALCVRGDKFPGGFCTIPCLTDADCTIDTVCVKDAGGVCAFPCASDLDCADLLEPRYDCRNREDFFDHDRRVCMGD
jgi:hypothetical protein